MVESTEQKEKKELTVKMWLAASQEAPNTLVADREGSPARIRKAVEMTRIKIKR